MRELLWMLILFVGYFVGLVLAPRLIGLDIRICDRWVC